MPKVYFNLVITKLKDKFPNIFWLKASLVESEQNKSYDVKEPDLVNLVHIFVMNSLKVKSHLNDLVKVDKGFLIMINVLK